MESENTPALKLYARLGYKEAWRDPTAKAAKVATRPPARPPARPRGTAAAPGVAPSALTARGRLRHPRAGPPQDWRARTV